jgi:hypothetical protein
MKSMVPTAISSIRLWKKIDAIHLCRCDQEVAVAISTDPPDRR